ncbi:MAG: LysR family transcriptional regulator [Proteobacteria bacterium]|jgi:molybdate transport system regulatory protein|nr:LysR family transcriptional regulator [Pseudomonadota bacterium]
MRVRTKIWLETDDGLPVLGDGRLGILEAIARTGSLSAAARELGMSYRALWGKVRSAEERLGVPLVRGFAGGEHHGGAALTDEARSLVAAFTALRDKAEAAVGKLAAKELKGHLPSR